MTRVDKPKRRRLLKDWDSQDGDFLPNVGPGELRRESERAWRRDYACDEDSVVAK